MADTDELSPAEIEARMSAGLKQALVTPPAKAKVKASGKRAPAAPARQSA